MDLKSRDKWIEYAKAKDEVFFYTDMPEALWYTVEAGDKHRARLNCTHPYMDVISGKIKLLRCKDHGDRERPPHRKLYFVDEKS